MIKIQATATTTDSASQMMTFAYESCPVLTAAETAVVTGDGAGIYQSGSIVYVEEAAP